MICEAQRQTRIGQLPRDVSGTIWIGAQAVRIDRTLQRLGGTRAWFLCPSCTRRCAVLYPVHCRKCLGLHYRSEHLSPNNRATLQAQRLRRRLGQSDGHLGRPMPAKPKWMRWHTYFARRAKVREADARHLAGMMAYLAGVRRVFPN